MVKNDMVEKDMGCPWLTMSRRLKEHSYHTIPGSLERAMYYVLRVRDKSPLLGASQAHNNAPMVLPSNGHCSVPEPSKGY